MKLFLSIMMCCKVLAAVVLAAAICTASTTTQPKVQTKKVQAKSGTKSPKSKKARVGSRKGKRTNKTSWRRGQQKIDSERARQIQGALIREHYLSGEPTGTWDQRSQNAMVKFQGDNGWQTKVVPDSRALIKLGLGPSNDHLLNPDSAMTSPLQPTSVAEHAPPGTPVSPAAATEPVSDPQK